MNNFGTDFEKKSFLKTKILAIPLKKKDYIILIAQPRYQTLFFDESAQFHNAINCYVFKLQGVRLASLALAYWEAVTKATCTQRKI